MNAQTKENLITALHGEAFAYLKYLSFAKQAREEGRVELADLYEKIANGGRMEHFAEEAALLGLVGTAGANLEAAISGESYETVTMYPEFAAQAAAAGDKAAADLFAEIGNDEKAHLAEFKSALQALHTAPTVAR
jgi:rubrerythrin